MKKSLKKQALLAFKAVEASSRRLTAEECTQKLSDVESALREIGQAAGYTIEVRPVDIKLLKNWAVSEPGALHRHIILKLSDGGAIIAGIVAIPETGFLKFYTDPDAPLSRSTPIADNESALFQVVLDNMKGYVSPAYWENERLPALKAYLSPA